METCMPGGEPAARAIRIRVAGLGGVHCVSTDQQLRLALIEAASNDAADVIRIVQGTYTGPFTYSTSATGDGHDLSLEGGYTTPSCAVRGADAGQTVLDGRRTGTVLSITIADPAGERIPHVYIRGLTLTNGSASSGGGLYVDTVGRVEVTGNVFHRNEADGNGGGLLPGPWRRGCCCG